ncbi:MAG TPA: RDD family protein [Polyangiaceae bacterium]|nr:RDD family protein [Polyangiaceae bacterium]
MEAGAAPASDPGELLDTRTNIETPEHVVLSYHLAGPIRRGLAWGIDTVARGVVVLVFGLLLGLSSAVDHDAAGGLKHGLLLVLFFLLEWGYFVACDMLMSGRSPGKKALGLRVVSSQGLPVGLGDSLLRNLLRGADFLPVGYVLGVVSMLVDARFRRLGDLVAGTLVIFEPKIRYREPPRLSPPPSQAELSWLPAHVELSASEREAIELFMLRVSELPAARSDELADVLALPLAKRLRLRYSHPARFLGLLYHCHIQGGR